LKNCCKISTKKTGTQFKIEFLHEGYAEESNCVSNGTGGDNKKGRDRCVNK
jgi:hypothetical protein